MCEQTGVQFSELRASTHFMNDMGVFDFFDTVDYVSAIQREFGLVISDQEATKIERIWDLVEYLYERVTK